MSDLIPAQQTSVDAVRAFYAAKERHDLDATMALFADDAVYVLPLSNTGDPAPWFRHEGKPAVTDYQRAVLTRFAQVRMQGLELVPSPDGAVVFVTAHGDYVAHEGDTPYTNVYVFRFAFRDGLVVHVDEYANPVTYAKLAGFPLG